MRRDDIASGRVRLATLEEMKQQLREILAMTRFLPADFRQLRTMVEDRHQEVARKAMVDGPTKADLVEDYLRENDLLSKTSQGTAYLGFSRLLSSTQTEQLRVDIDQILTQEFAREHMTAAQREELDSMLSTLLAAELQVQNSYVRWSASLRRFLTRAAHLVRPAGGLAPPMQRADHLGEVDRLGIGDREQTRDTESLVFRAGWEEQRCATVPAVSGVIRTEVVISAPSVGTKHKSRKHRIESGRRAEPAKQPPMCVLSGDNLRQVGEIGLRMVDLVRRSDPDTMAGAGVVVVAEKLDDGTVGVTGVAAPAAALWFMAQGPPVRSRDTEFDDRVGEAFARLVDDVGELVGFEGAAFAVAAALPTDLLPELVDGRGAA